LNVVGDIALLENVLRQMQHLRIKPDIITANTAIYGYGVARNAEAAVSVVEEWMPKKAIPPDSRTLQTLSESLVAVARNEPDKSVRSLQWDRTLSLITRLAEKHELDLGERPFVSMVRGCAVVGDIRQATENHETNHDSKPNHEPKPKPTSNPDPY